MKIKAYVRAAKGKNNDLQVSYVNYTIFENCAKILCILQWNFNTSVFICKLHIILIVFEHIVYFTLKKHKPQKQHHTAVNTQNIYNQPQILLNIACVVTWWIGDFASFGASAY